MLCFPTDQPSNCVPQVSLHVPVLEHAEKRIMQRLRHAPVGFHKGVAFLRLLRLASGCLKHVGTQQAGSCICDENKTRFVLPMLVALASETALPAGTVMPYAYPDLPRHCFTGPIYCLYNHWHKDSRGAIFFLRKEAARQSADFAPDEGLACCMWQAHIQH